MEIGEISRRDALKSIALFSTGVALVTIGGTRVFGSTLSKQKNPTFIEAKVVYFGVTMIQMTGTKEEYFELQAPAQLQDLLSQIQRRHEVFAAMLPTMQIVVDGNPFTPQDNPKLQDNCEIDFIPVFAGG